MVKLNVNGVECHYGSTKILSDINLEVKPGDFVGVLGPNGSGKTTLLRSISRVLKPHGGSILIDDDNIYELKPVDVAERWLLCRRIRVWASTFPLWMLF